MPDQTIVTDGRYPGRPAQIVADIHAGTSGGDARHRWSYTHRWDVDLPADHAAARTPAA